MKKIIVLSLLSLSSSLSAATIRITNSLSQPIIATVNSLAKPLTQTIAPGKTAFYDTHSDPANFVSWKIVNEADAMGWHVVRIIDSKQLEAQFTIKKDGAYTFQPCILPSCRMEDGTASKGMLPQPKVKPQISKALAEEL